MTGVARRVAAAQVHLGGPAGIRRPAGGESEQGHHGPHRGRHGEMLSAARIPALVESATRIALPTARAPGIFDWARMLSRWRSVSESPAAVRDVPDWPPPQAVTTTITTRPNGTRTRIMWEVPSGGRLPSRPRTGRSPQRWYRHSASPARS